MASLGGIGPKPVKVVGRPADPQGMPAPRSALVPAALLAALAGSLVAGAGTAVPAAAATRTAATAAVATTYVPTTADVRIAARLSTRAAASVLGTHYSGTVIDVASNRVVWSRNGSVGRMPASTAKLITATNALTVFGPDHRFTTTVRRDATHPSWVYLVGAGDPSLSGANLDVLADQTAAEVSGMTSLRVFADDHVFSRPSLARGWKASYVPTDVRWVRALVVDGHHATDTSLDAAKVFAAKLKARGATITSVSRRTAPRPSTGLASVQGQRLDAIVKQMLLVSDNDHAEALNRLVATKAGYAATWTGAAQAQRVVLARDGVQIPAGAMFDGSGLSRSDRLTTGQLARVVDNFLESGQSDLAVLRSGGLPLAGRTGTLTKRFVKQATCARGKVVAKTGTLQDAVSLVGYATGTDGRLKAFAFVVNGKTATTAIKNRVDVLAATVTGCY
ncbi:D-alanyl-D-alanine carboxypeptidase/D-alanyl-D-alanine endopeptidase [Angustibacter luteus]|uniref:D-alanyl-D-alanine carboxypeptidase/D-alanyl-D-alanine-endopeptidase n=1 Tax=Angustibacter luteus TaxID=658456 RepID=A0ABW1JD29_9ACTN